MCQEAKNNQFTVALLAQMNLDPESAVFFVVVFFFPILSSPEKSMV